MYNNIILSNGAYGIKRTSSEVVYAAYNDIYGNTSGPTNGVVTLGAGNTFDNPFIETITSFTIISASSPCVDSGTNILSEAFNGNEIDMGWKESPFTAPSSYPVHNLTTSQDYLTISAAISAILNGNHIQIDSGAYNENINLSKLTNIIIEATSWASNGINTNTILDGDSSNPVISLSYSFGCQIIGFTVKNGSYGIFSSANSPNSNYIAHNNIYSNVVGVGITNGDFNTITSNNIYKCTNAIYITGTSVSNTVFSNSIYSNYKYGIYIDHNDSDNNFIQNNNITGIDLNRGIFIVDGDNNLIDNNQIYKIYGTFTEGFGVYLDGSARSNQIFNNTIYSNDASGIRINSASADYNIIYNNHIYGTNQNQGVYIYSGDYNTVRSNLIHNNAFDGIRFGVDGKFNQIFKNNIYSNANYGIYINDDDVDNNYIYTNNIWGLNQQWGIYLASGDNNIIYSNQIHHNKDHGIHIAATAINNEIIKNSIYSNDLYGVRIVNADNNSVLTNNIYGKDQDYGVYSINSLNTKIYRNVIHYNQIRGIFIDGGNDIEIINNTILKSVSGSGIYWNNTSNGTMYNNIILSNNDYGIDAPSTGSVFMDYNCLYGNSNGPTNGGLIWGNHNSTNNPLIETVTSFTIISASSPCIDSGTNILSEAYNGNEIDMGWKESSFAGINNGPFYVDDTTGSNTFAGTFAKPFRTIQKAANTMMPGVTVASCYIFPGSYSETVEIYSNKNSGYMVFTALTNSNQPVMTGSLISNHGFFITNAGKIWIQELYITKYNYGIILKGSATNNYIVKNSIYSNDDYGIYINSDTADNNYILTNNVYGTNQDYGVYINDGDNNIIKFNHIYENKNRGIYFTGNTTNNYIIKNSVYLNGNDGVTITGNDTDRNYVLTNYIWGNQSDGILISHGDNNIVKSNQIYNNQIGVYIFDNARSNSIVMNAIYSNNDYGIFLKVGAQGPAYNYIFKNNIWGTNQNYGIYGWGTSYNTIKSNEIHHHGFYGIYWTFASDNYISKNNVYSNNSVGIFLCNSGNKTYVSTNKIWGENQDWGIAINGSHNNDVNRNLICNNLGGGILLYGTCTNINVINNTIFGTLSGHGIWWTNASWGYMYNNIVLSNNGYGIYQYSTETIYAAYNDIYGNTSGPTNGSLNWGDGNIFQDPMIETTTSFTITSPYSFAVDNGTNIPGVTDNPNGNGPDMGWKESDFTFIYQGPFYVDDNSGDDSNYGSFNKPFKTIQKAANRISTGIDVSSATCYIFPGTYSEQVEIYSNKNSDYMVFTALTNTNSPVMTGSLVSNHGFFITNASSIIIRELKITKYTQGIILTGIATNNYIIKSTIYSNDNCGIYVNSDTADNNIIATNNIYGLNQDYGIYIENGDNNIIKSNKIYFNEMVGIVIDGKSNEK